MKGVRRFHPVYGLLLSWACLTVLLVHLALSQTCLPSPLRPLMGMFRIQAADVAQVSGVVVDASIRGASLVHALRSAGSLGRVAIANQSPTAADETALETVSQRNEPSERAQFLGHYAYAEIHPVQLMTVGSYTTTNGVQRFEQLEKATGKALMTMLDAARQDGVWIVPISGFRDQEEQGRLFDFTRERSGSLRRAARSVAPPGYSEHHSGYAVDLGDGLARAKDVSRYFEDTDAFQWLTQRASEFGFELSFPEGNDQGVIYEPWHWRYVGSLGAATTFGKAEPQP
ncbi:MAG: M15 family metallopeptidase [Cyanobacteria bacterium J06632_22]